VEGDAVRISCGHWARCGTRGCETEGRALRTGPGGGVAECEDLDTERRIGGVAPAARAEPERKAGIEEWALALPGRFGTTEAAAAWGVSYAAAVYRARKLAQAGVLRVTGKGRWARTGEDIPGPESGPTTGPEEREAGETPRIYERDAFAGRIAMLPDEFRAGDAVRAWGLSRSPASRVLRISEERGLIARTSFGRYRKILKRRKAR
jgi:hypothetical protein